MKPKYVKPVARNLGDIYSAQGACSNGSNPQNAPSSSCTNGLGASKVEGPGACSTGSGATGHPGHSSCTTGTAASY
jgi:hypothetical protein